MNKPKVEIDYSLLCKGCIRDMKGVSMNDKVIDGKWISPYDQKMMAAKCSKCKHDE